jgi:hypothetical protein
MSMKNKQRSDKSFSEEETHLSKRQKHEKTKTILSLPREMFFYILSPFLTMSDTFCLSIVNRNYHTFVTQHSNWSNKEYISRSIQSFHSFVSGPKRSKFGKVDLSRLVITQNMLEMLSQHLPQMRILKIQRFPNNVDFGSFFNLKALEFVHSFTSPFTNLTNDALATLPDSVETLNLHLCQETANDFKFNHLVNLKNVDLSYTNVTHEVISTLPVSIEKLNLYCCQEITDFSSLQRLVNLKDVNLSYTNVTHEVILTLSDSVETLILYLCKNINKDLKLSHLVNLRNVDLSGTDVTNDVIATLPSSFAMLKLIYCENIDNHVDLSTIDLTNDLIIKNLPINVKTLKLFGCRNITKHLKFNHLINLKNIDLSETDVTNGVLATSSTKYKDAQIKPLHKNRQAFEI